MSGTWICATKSSRTPPRRKHAPNASVCRVLLRSYTSPHAITRACPHARMQAPARTDNTAPMWGVSVVLGFRGSGGTVRAQTIRWGANRSTVHGPQSREPFSHTWSTEARIAGPCTSPNAHNRAKGGPPHSQRYATLGRGAADPGNFQRSAPKSAERHSNRAFRVTSLHPQRCLASAR